MIETYTFYYYMISIIGTMINSLTALVWMEVVFILPKGIQTYFQAEH